MLSWIIVRIIRSTFVVVGGILPVLIVRTVYLRSTLVNTRLLVVSIIGIFKLRRWRWLISIAAVREEILYRIRSWLGCGSIRSLSNHPHINVESMNNLIIFMNLLKQERNVVSEDLVHLVHEILIQSFEIRDIFDLWNNFSMACRQTSASLLTSPSIFLYWSTLGKSPSGRL